ncbi:DUF6916 family protein [Methylocucumis oryzae]|uniref:DUF6916 domain-containing protein n=1 Tax=Methylocucumis oryzae TaxID=1632867 RepID=A0A0F3IHD0_9GAMM|nr:hypothetical protein [Methylocucumis oryzae]KJV06151.1 hypothetical protein VZ94_13195 [Methylocucumis oryzae]
MFLPERINVAEFLKPSYRYIKLFLLGLLNATLMTVLIFIVTEQVSAANNNPHSFADFNAHLGQSFTVYGGAMGEKVWSKTVELKLIALSAPRKNGSTEQFSVRFQGPIDYPLAKGVYTFENPKTDRFELFLEPYGADTSARYYQAVFNLIT